jgi:malonyl-CoA O-methyltransferase
MLQWCQDPGRAIAEVLGVLRPGGLFAFSSLGPDTLHELRESWAAADQATHVNTFVDMHDLGDALLHAGFADPVIDSDRVIMNYESVPGLMQDLRNLGAANVNQSRRKSLTGKGRLTKMLQAYETKRMGGKLPATYEVIYGHAWKPAGNTGHENGTFRISLDTLKETLGRFTSKKR